MYARRKSSSSFCRLVSIPGASSSGHPKRRRGETQMFLSEALRRPDAGGRSTLAILARRCSDADGRDGSRAGARQRADRRAGGRSGWRRAACHSLLPRARIARHSARPRVCPGARAARPSSPARVPAARRATHRAGRLQPRGLPGAAHVSALAAATRSAGWAPRARLRVRHAVVKLFCMRLTPARRLALAVLAAALAAPGARSDEGAPERVIHYEGDTLTVRLAGAPVTDVLDELGRQAGAEIRGQVRDPHEVSAEFEGVPLAEALHRLLGDQNFALVYGNQGRLKSVRLLGGPQTAAAAAPIPAAAAPPAGQPSAPGIVDAFAKHAPIAVAGHLGEALGGHEASLLQLFDLSVHNADPTVRAEAARIVIGTIDTDPSLRASVLAQLNAMDDAALGAFFRSMAGDNAQEVAMQIMTTARTSEFRSKASVVLQQLRAGG